MTHQWTPPGTSPEQPPAPQPRKRHRTRTFFYVVWGAIGTLILLIVAIVLAAVFGSSGGQSGGNVATSSSSAAPAAAPSSAPAPPVAADPQVKGQGSCDYLLGDSPSTGTASVVAEMDMHNTGNVGVTVRARVTWPQEGSEPIAAHKTVSLAFGANRTVRFKVPISGDQVDSLQSWQERHDFNDGCHYTVKLGATFGTVHS